MTLNIVTMILACVGAGTTAVMAGALARKLGSLWQRTTPEMQCVACGHKGLMGVLAPGKYCCAPCREEIWAEVEGDTRVALARRLSGVTPPPGLAWNIGAYTVIDCHPKDVIHFAPPPTEAQHAALDAIVRDVWGDEETAFVPLAQVLKERFDLGPATTGELRDGESVYVLTNEPGHYELVYSKGDLEAVTPLPYHGEDYETFLVGLRIRCMALVDSCRAMGLREGETFVSGAKS